MKTKLFFLAFLTSLLSWGQGSESFTNSNATTSYSANSFVGDASVTWSYIESRDEATFGITGKGLMLRRSSSSSRVTSSSVSGGIGNFTCDLRKAFTGAGNRQVELFVNGISQGTSIAWDNTSVQTFTVNNINISGSVIIEIRNITANQVIVDNISWTGYTAGPAPSLAITPAITNLGTSCVGTPTTAVTYTITNTGTVAATGVTVVSSGAEFVVSGLSSTTIPASGGTAT